MLAYCDNTTEALAGMPGKGGAGSDTTADLLAVMDAAITAVPPKHRRLMITCDSTGASHGLITRLDELSARIIHYPWLEPLTLAVAIQQQRDHHRRAGRRPPVPVSPVPAAELAQIQRGHRVQHDERQVVLGQPLAHVHRHQCSSMSPRTRWSGAEPAGPTRCRWKDCERFLSESAFRGRQNTKLRYAVLAAAALHGGTEPDLLDEVAWWQTDGFWQYALFAAVAYIRAAASRAGVPVSQACQDLARRPSPGP